MTEMVRILADLDHGYSSHSFVELYWDSLVHLVKKEFQLVGGNRWVFSQFRHCMWLTITPRLHARAPASMVKYSTQG